MEKLSHKTNFIVNPRTRLVALSSETEVAMKDFTACNFCNSCSTNHFVTELVKKEIDRCLKELDTKIESYIKKEEVPEIISKCVKNNNFHQAAVTTNVATNTIPTTTGPETEGNSEMERSKPTSLRQQQNLKDGFSVLEQRINMLECKISALFQIKKLRNIAGKIKIDGPEFAVDKKMLDNGQDQNMEPKIPKQEFKNKIKKIDINPYDDLYYEWRQNKMNLLHYKKSEGTLRLNRISESDLIGPLPDNTFGCFMKSQQMLN